MNYESAPSGVSHEALLKVIEGRSTIGRAYEERLYLVDLTSHLTELCKKSKLRGQHYGFGERRSDLGNT